MSSSSSLEALGGPDMWREARTGQGYIWSGIFDNCSLPMTITALVSPPRPSRFSCRATSCRIEREARSGRSSRSLFGKEPSGLQDSLDPSRRLLARLVFLAPTLPLPRIQVLLQHHERMLLTLMPAFSLIILLNLTVLPLASSSLQWS
jgi:hypothetical protein